MESAAPCTTEPSGRRGRWRGGRVGVWMRMEMTGSPGGEDPGRRRQRSAGKPRRRWGGLRQRWKMLGVFEIDQSHAFYGLTCMMKEGLSAAVQNTIDNPPTNELSDDDYLSEMIKIHQEFQMKTFAGKVFANLRSSLGITESAYQESLCSEACYLQFISNSKSKADFFLTNDKRFFLKTQNKREIHFLLDHLHVYVEHLRNYPHSLLVKFLGVHRMTINRQQKYFIVMQSVFYPDERINTRYDIKGCELSRWTEPAPEGSQVIVVLKDLNFKGNGQQIVLDQQRAWLLRQVEIDTQFLQSLNVLDYSLLLAQQPLHQDEKLAPLSLANLIVRTKKSVNPGSPIHAGATGEDPSAPPRLSAETDSFCLSRTSDGGGGDPPPPSLEDFRAQNRRLLPNFKNPLHVIDGPEQRYFVGIIDIFTVYGFRKRLEHWWKRLRHPGQSFSTVSPPAYCLRLCQWTRDNTA